MTSHILKGANLQIPVFCQMTEMGLRVQLRFCSVSGLHILLDGEFPRTFDKEFTKNCFTIAIIREVLPDFSV